MTKRLRALAHSISEAIRIGVEAERLMLGYKAQGLTEKEVFARWTADLRAYTESMALRPSEAFRDACLRAGKP